MRKLIRLTLAACALLWAGAAAAADPAAAVATLNAFRGFADRAFHFDVTLTSFRGGAPRESQSARVYFRDHGAVLVDFLAPRSVSGRRILFEGRNVWLAIPSTARNIRVTADDRLMGEASNGDVVNLDFAAYDAAFAAPQAHAGRTLDTLALTARPGGGAQYGRVEFLLEPGSGRPVRSLHYAPSGKLLRVGDYLAFASTPDGEKLSRLRLSDPVDAAAATELAFSSYVAADLPATLFARAALRAPLSY